jgi:predicted aspartyl protease
MDRSVRPLAARLVAVALLLLAPVAAVRAQAAPDPPASVVELGTDLSDRMTVPVRIGGAGPFDFIVDTAATGTVISRELAAELQLKPAGRLRMLSLTGSAEVTQVHVPALTLIVGEPQDVRAFALREADIGGRGILGIDMLRDRRVLLDFRTRTFAVTKAPRRWSEEEDDDTIVVTARRRLGQLILAESSIDGEKIDVIVDTGAQVSLGNLALRRRLLKDGSRYKISPITLIGVTGGAVGADYTRVDRLRIGRVGLIGMPIAFADAYPFRRLKLRRPALLLGMDALRMFERVTVDFANRKASFDLPDEIAGKPSAGAKAGAQAGAERRGGEHLQ